MQAGNLYGGGIDKLPLDGRYEWAKRHLPVSEQYKSRYNCGTMPCPTALQHRSTGRQTGSPVAW